MLNEDACTKESKYVTKIDEKIYEVTRADYTGNMIYN